MHELSIVMEVIRQVEAIAREHQVEQVEKIVLSIGEATPIVPRFVEECFPVAIDGTSLGNTQLEIEIVPANGMCRQCQKVFHILEVDGICPQCGQHDYEVISGKDFILKQIVIVEETEDE